MTSVRLSCVASLLLGTACVSADDSVPTELVREAIIQGHPARADEQWGTVGLDVFIGEEDGWTCTGTLIGSRLVVTAAHCVIDDTGEGFSAMYVIAGAADLYAATAEQSYEVARYLPHPDALQGGGSFDPTGLGAENDIAIVETVEPVTQVAVVPVLAQDRVDEVLTAGKPLVIAGYGVTSVEMDDASALHNVGSVSYVRRSDHEFLAGNSEESDTCVGDSGGPVYVMAGGQMALVGATSRGREDGNVACGAGGIYTLVPAYLDWIEAVAMVPVGEETEPVEDAGMPDEERDAAAGVPDAGADVEDASVDGEEQELPERVRKSKRGGCAVQPGTAHAPWLALLGAALLWRRRPHQNVKLSPTKATLEPRDTQADQRALPGTK